MNKTKLTFLVAIIVYTIPAWAQEQVRSFTIDEAVMYAYDHNWQIENADLDIKKAEQDVNATLSGGLPQVNGLVEYTNYPALPVNLIPAEFVGGQPGEFAEIRFGTSNNLNASVNATQMIFDGSYFAGLKASKLYVDLTQKEYELSRVETRANVLKAYYGVLITKRNRQILEDTKAVIAELYNETKAMFDNGFVEEIEVDRIELSWSNIDTRLKNARRQENLSYAVLKFQMGYPLADSLQLADSIGSIEAVDNDLMAQAIPVQQTLDYELLHQRIELTQTNISNIRAGYYPNAELFATYQQNAQRNEFTFFEADRDWFETALWGVRVNIPIWDSFRKKAEVQKEQINIEQLRNQQQQLQSGHDVELREKRKDYLNALDDFENQKENLELSEKIFNTTVNKYEEGVGSSLEVDNARSTYFETQAGYINALYNLLIAKTELEQTLEIQ